MDDGPSPTWDALYATAAAQEGLFTTAQAAAAGYSPQLLVHHVKRGRARRVQRRIYRLVHFPPGEHEELVAAWLWSEQAAVISHDSALALHQLSDVLPARIHLTVPAAWRRRRLRIPAGYLLHHRRVGATDRTWFGNLPITSVRRTLDDCAQDGLAPDLLQQAARQALDRGLVTLAELGAVVTALAPFGGIPG